MKLVLQLSSSALEQKASLETLALVVSKLLADGHRITIVHGGFGPLSRPADGNGAGFPLEQAVFGHTGFTQESLFGVTVGINKTLVAAMGTRRVQALGLCGSDANLVRTRKAGAGQGHGTGAIEVAEVHPFWLNVIAEHGGVPVLANLAMTADRNHCTVDADQLAAACAIGWHADALIFLVECEGVRNADGSIVRWLHTDALENVFSPSSVDSSLLSKLQACQRALKQGVCRARVLPLARLEALSSFYFARVDCGTEVVLSPQSPTPHSQDIHEGKVFLKVANR